MTDEASKIAVDYKLWRRTVTDERSYFVITFAKPDNCASDSFVPLACGAFMEIMASNQLDDFLPGDFHLECNSGAPFSKEDSKWKEKFSDDYQIPDSDLTAFMSGRYRNDEPTMSFSFFGPRNKVEKFFDPEGDYSAAEIDPEWYCEGYYSAE